MKKLKIISLVALAFSLHSCRKDFIYVAPIEPTPTNLSFVNDIFPLLTTYNCKNCHSGSTAPKITTDPIATYAVLTSTTGTTWVNLVTPSLSRFYISVTIDYPAQMPKNSSPKLSNPEQARILAWITQGAHQ